MTNKKWDLRFLKLIEEASNWSKDPSTQVACVIVDKNNRVVSMGYNGFAKGVDDSKFRYEDREMKLNLVVHSEINAIIFAQRDLTDCTIYTYPMPPCSKCTSAIIQAGIKRIVAIEETKEQKQRWNTDFEWARIQREEANIDFTSYPISALSNKCQGKCKCKT